MTLAFWCVLLAALMPIVWAGCAKIGGDGFDNARPRAYLRSLSGWRLRAHWAQENAYEAFPPFAAAVIIASMVKGPAAIIDILAGVFLLTRFLHGLLYIQDRSTLRSLVWLAGFGCVVGLFLVAAS
ncbi:MAG: MAPEG family protein [Chromatiales bacterium]|nr:MAPEG family protein [Chromatiales bacterium]